MKRCLAWLEGPKLKYPSLKMTSGIMKPISARPRIVFPEPIRSAAGLKPLDLQDLEKRVDEVKKQTDAAKRSHVAEEEKLSRLDKIVKDYQAAEKDRESLEAKYAVIGRIADTANGRNDRRITFQRFVLSALLDDVLLAASQRLAKMTSSRFTLRRVEETSDKRRSGGLDLQVDDAYTGSARPVATLSGGESFLGVARVGAWLGRRGSILRRRHPS